MLTHAFSARLAIAVQPSPSFW